MTDEKQRQVWWILYFVGSKSGELGPFYSEKDVKETFPRLERTKNVRSITYYSYREKKTEGNWVGAGGMTVYNKAGQVVWPPASTEENA